MNKESPEGDGNFLVSITMYFIVLHLNKGSPEGDGNITFFVLVTANLDLDERFLEGDVF